MFCIKINNTGIFDTRYEKIDGIPVAITEPEGKPQGITFLVTGANMPLTSYKSIRRALRSVNQVVVEYQYSIFSFHSMNNDNLARSIDNIFQKLRDEYEDVTKYGIVGHGVGGKIALMVASMFGGEDDDLDIALALDPIDKFPVRFINGSLNFQKCACSIFITSTGAVEDNGALEIYFRHENYIQCLYHSGAGHNAYCDGTEELSFWNQRLQKGTPQRNRDIKSRTIKTIKTSFCWATQSKNLEPQERESFRQSLRQSIFTINNISSRNLGVDEKENSGGRGKSITETFPCVTDYSSDNNDSDVDEDRKQVKFDDNNQVVLLQKGKEGFRKKTRKKIKSGFKKAKKGLMKVAKLK